MTGVMHASRIGSTLYRQPLLQFLASAAASTMTVEIPSVDAVDASDITPF